MRISGRAKRAAVLFGTAVFGMLAAHELDYRLVVPDPSHRHDLLLRTGHGYLSKALFVALAAGILAAVTAVILGYTQGRAARGAHVDARGVGICLAVVQSGGFVLLESVERLLVGAPPDDRLLAVGAVGVGVQILVAALGALLLGLVAAAAAAVARAVSAWRPRVVRARSWASGGSRRIHPHRLLLSGATSSRGPPSPIR